MFYLVIVTIACMNIGYTSHNTRYVDVSFRSEIGYGLCCLMTPDLSMDIQCLV